jgi:hypothetical protein
VNQIRLKNRKLEPLNESNVMVISIHTIFILRENILFLEEWIDYHILLGVTRFYLYDNSGSTDVIGGAKGLNRYNMNFLEPTSHLSDDDIYMQLTSIFEKYGSMISYIKWQPRNMRGDVVYGQKKGIIDYIRNYAGGSDWTAFIDMDEFIYCKYPLKQVIAKYDSAGVGDITILQKKFDDRFNNLGTPVTHITRCIEGINTLHWGPKHLVKNKCFFMDEPDYWNIHLLPTRDCYCAIADPNEIRFNHYNVNEFQLKWMMDFYETEKPFALNAVCLELYSKVLGVL